MTLDEIITALKEWGNDEDRHYFLIAVEGDKTSEFLHGGAFPLGCGLADAMRGLEGVETMISVAKFIKQLNLVHIDDIDSLIDDVKNRENRQDHEEE